MKYTIWIICRSSSSFLLFVQEIVFSSHFGQNDKLISEWERISLQCFLWLQYSNHPRDRDGMATQRMLIVVMKIVSSKSSSVNSIIMHSPNGTITSPQCLLLRFSSLPSPMSKYSFIFNAQSLSTTDSPTTGPF